MPHVLRISSVRRLGQAPHLPALAQARVVHPLLTPADRLWLAVCLVVALGVRLVAAVMFPNMHYPDEVFQTLEQAHRLVFGYGIVPWEFTDGIRSWLTPGLIAAVMRATSWLGRGSSGYLFSVQALLSTISLLPVYVAFRWTQSEWGRLAGIAAGLFVATWFELVYFAPKALTEAVAASVLVYALYRGSIARRLDEPWRWFVFGALTGLTFGLRLHLALGLAIAVIWLCRTDVRKRWVPVSAGAVAVLAVFGLFDWITWDYPFQSLILNVKLNVLDRRSEHYGTAPWHFYVQVIGRTWFLWGPVMVGLAILGMRRKYHWAGAVAVGILISHSLLAHKEYRFLLPAVMLVVVMAALGLGRLVAAAGTTGSKRVQMATLVGSLLLVTAVSVLLGQRFDGYATGLTNRRPTQSHWSRDIAGLDMFNYLSKRSDVCGVATIGRNWAWTGGYTYLHHDVPIIFDSTPNQLNVLSPDVNVIAAIGPVALPSYFEKVATWDGYAVFIDPTRCGSGH